MTKEPAPAMFFLPAVVSSMLLSLPQASPQQIASEITVMKPVAGDGGNQYAIGDDETPLARFQAQPSLAGERAGEKTALTQQVDLNEHTREVVRSRSRGYLAAASLSSGAFVLGIGGALVVASTAAPLQMFVALMAVVSGTSASVASRLYRPV